MARGKKIPRQEGLEMKLNQLQACLLSELESENRHHGSTREESFLFPFLGQRMV